MLTTETASAVVQRGSGDTMPKEELIECHATSSFSIEGEHIQSGSTIHVSEATYKELRAAQRVEPGPAPKSKGKEKGTDEKPPAP